MYQNPEHVIDVHMNLLVIHWGLALLLVLYLLLVLVLGLNNIQNHLLKQLNQLLGQEEMLGKVVDLLVLCWIFDWTKKQTSATLAASSTPTDGGG